MTSFIHISKTNLNSLTCNKLINLFEETPWLHSKGQTGSQDGKNDLNNKIKVSTDIGIDPTFLKDKEFGPLVRSVIDFVEQELEEYKNKFTQLNDLAEWKMREKFNIQRYLPNQGYYAWHCEHHPSNPLLANRLLSWTIYLNTVEDGGTEYMNFETVDALQGRCVIWPSYWTHFHRGVISTTKTKYIATGWYNFIG